MRGSTGERPNSRRFVNWALTASLLLFLPFGAGCICFIMCVRINGTDVFNSCARPGQPQCSEDSAPYGGAGFVGGPEACNSLAWVDGDGDGMSDATEKNTTNAYLAAAPCATRLDPNTANVDPSRATGTLTNGHLVCGLNLVDRSTKEGCGGYHRYFAYCGPGVQEPFDERDWGTATLLRVIEHVAYLWKSQVAPTKPRFGVGQMSFKDGGYQRFFCDTTRAHAQHQQGREADFRYIRKDKSEVLGLDLSSASGRAELDTTATRALVEFFNAQPEVETIYVSSYTGYLSDGAKIVNDNPTGSRDHDNHFHVTIADPDGTGN